MTDGSGTADAPTLFGQRDPVFRPWPLPGKEPASIADFVLRVKAQGGEFRKLTEEGLRAEIAKRQRKQQAGGGAGDDDEDDDDGDDGGSATAADAVGENGSLAGDASGKGPKSLEAMIATRDEVLRALESALQSGLIVVDFVSLLLSKDRPTQALQTLSPLLREKIGIGTLSAGRIANAAQAARALQSRGGGSGGSSSQAVQLDETTRFNAQRVLDNKIECVGWQLLAMDRASQLLAAGRKRLHAELRREETYWSEVVAVRDGGWGLSRTPGQRRVLRVKYGFSEAAPDLRAAGFAPLRRVKRGHVALDLSALGPPSAVVVTMRRRRNQSGESEKIGRSSVPVRLPETAPLEERILEARNTVYAKELWRELNREARQMVAHGVSLRAEEIVFPAGAHVEGVMALRPLELAAAETDPADPTGGSNDEKLRGLAETAASALHLLLAHGHRQHYRQRSTPAPPSDSSSAAPPVYFLLRPIVANLKYEKAIAHIAGFLSDLCAILHAVGRTDARFTLYERPLSASLPAADASDGDAAAQRSGSRPLSSSEAFCTGFLAPREFTFELVVAADTRLSIRSRTTVVPLKTQYLIQLLPPLSSPINEGAKNPLQDLFPPADNYSALRDLTDYLGDAVAHLLTVQARSLACAHETAKGTGVVWSTAVDGKAVHQQNNMAWSLQFCMVPAGVLTAEDELLEVDSRKEEETEEAEGEEEDDGHEKAIRNVDSPLDRPPPPELRLYASWPVAQRESSLQRRWVWTAESPQPGQPAADGAATPSLQDILRGCISGELRPAEA